jgi:hypothetical protein
MNCLLSHLIKTLQQQSLYKQKCLQPVQCHEEDTNKAMMWLIYIGDQRKHESLQWNCKLHNLLLQRFHYSKAELRETGRKMCLWRHMFTFNKIYERWTADVMYPVTLKVSKESTASMLASMFFLTFYDLNIQLNDIPCSCRYCQVVPKRRNRSYAIGLCETREMTISTHVIHLRG